jgi:hypothetical protein
MPFLYARPFSEFPKEHDVQLKTTLLILDVAILAKLPRQAVSFHLLEVLFGNPCQTGLCFSIGWRRLPDQKKFLVTALLSQVACSLKKKPWITK